MAATAQSRGGWSEGMRGTLLLMAAACAVLILTPAAAPAASAVEHGASAATEFSAQSRQQRQKRRAQRQNRRPRITVRPRPRDVRGMRRECVATFEERYIPQWGGNVLYAGQRCWWVPGRPR